MSSNIIYHHGIPTRIIQQIQNGHIMEDRTPYCYYICWTKFNIHYYGRRTARWCHPTDFWKKYFTSSAYVKQFREQHGDPDVIEIRKIFNSVEKCCNWETDVLNRLKIKEKEHWLNKAIYGKYTLLKTMPSLKELIPDELFVPCSDEQTLNKALRHGMLQVIDNNGQRKRMSIHDYLPVTGEFMVDISPAFYNKEVSPKRKFCYVCHTTPCAIAYHRNGHTYYRDRCDQCYKERKTPTIDLYTKIGYTKKETCEKCSRPLLHPDAISIYYDNSDSNPNSLSNLKTICIVCAIDLKHDPNCWNSNCW